MKQYPSITTDAKSGLYYYAFDKLDGSNIRAEWSRKSGLYKFGSRSVLIDVSSPLGEAETLIRSKYEDELSKRFRKAGYDRVCCFFEFFGKHSFAGQHIDESHDVVLIDVSPYKKGILFPTEFLKLTDGIEIPQVLYQGNITQEFRDSVKHSTLFGMTFEGVVCKASNPKKTLMPVMFKLKSDAWRVRLKEFCAGNDDLYRKLA